MGCPKKAGYRPVTLPTLHSSFDPNWTNRVGAVPGGSFRVQFRMPESGRYTIAISILTSDSESLTLQITSGGGGRKKISGARFEASRPPKRASEGGPFWAILTIPAFIQNLIYIWESFHEKKPHAFRRRGRTCHYFDFESTPRQRGGTVARRRHKSNQLFLIF